jgi:hypothetical protein
MASSRATVAQSLSIALIVFVMLTFVLAVTTYLFFRQKVDAEAAAKTAATEMAQAKTDLQNSEAEKAKLKQILGFTDDKPVGDIETEVNEAFEKNFGDFKEDSKAYVSVTQWLLESVEAKDKDLKSINANNEQLQKEKVEAIAAADKRLADIEAKLKAKEKMADDLKKQFDDDRERHEELSKKLAEEHRKSLERAERLNLLDEEIAKGEPLLAAARQARFKTQPPEGKVGVLFEELKDRAKLIGRQNTLLADLRVADKALQDTVLAATPKDDRIDGFDGRILSVNPIDRSVLIDFGSTRGLRTGLVLRVYDPADPRPQAGDNKAVVEVVSVESDALARARVREDSIGNPILPGDRVATSLWAPGGSFEAVIVGFVQLDSDEKQDQDRLKQLVEGVGGHVEQSVTSTTTMLIDGGQPRTIGSGTERAPGWRPADEKRRENQLKEAQRLGIRVVGIDAFLRLMGLDRDMIDSNRLEHPGDRRGSPIRGGNVAY